MENQFHSVETWQGHVLVSASLLPPSVEEKERIYPDRSTYTRSSPQLALMNRRHGLHMAASLPPVPDYWNHEHRGQVEPVVDATCGSHLWLTPPMMNVIPSSTNFREACSGPMYPPPVHSDPMSAAEDRSSISSCWTPNSYDSDCTPPTDWDDAMTVTSSASASTPSPDRSFGEQQQALFFTAAFQSQPSLSPEDEQPPKRRRVSPEMPPIHNLYDSDGNLWL